ncbi:MAG TPA: cytochrome P450 [Candidatus Binataceae bacterium]|nr:cytochrome P450 [Candidatus Binataceae bacterium]
MPELYFNPWDPQFRADPYPAYRTLVEGPPRLMTFAGPVALVARYADVEAVLRDHGRFTAVRPPSLPIARRGPFAGAATVLTSDPPVHTRLRRLISREFTPRRIHDLEPRIRAIMAALLDAIEQRGAAEFDLMAEVANALPVMVIAELLGVPSASYGTFKQWSDAVVAGAGRTQPWEEPPAEFLDAVAALRGYFAEQIEARRRAPGADLVSALVAAHDDAEALSSEELLAFVVLLLLAGNETTTNLIGNGMLALGRNPEQLEMLRREPARMAVAIEEIVRYDGPVQATARFATEAVNIDGTEIPVGAPAFVLIAAANRDPAKFPAPEKFDITRHPNEHLGFGIGIHFCLGAPLARLEGAIAIGAMLARFARLRLADPAAPTVYKGSFFLRGLSALQMKID